MKTLFESQELARRFNQDEAIWQRFEQKRKLRQRFGPGSLLSEDLLDSLDWLESERECRETRCVGKVPP
jgi:hypothetical protein